MRRTMKNFAKVIEKKERAAWRNLSHYEKLGKTSVEYQSALSEWTALCSVRFMFESQEVFDTACETWLKKQTR